MRVLALVLAACAHGPPRAPQQQSTGDDVTLYRDVALVRQRVELEGARANVAVPAGVRASDVLVIEGHATVETAGPGELVVETGAPGHHSLVVEYITDKLRWDAAYTLTTTPARDRAVLRGTLAIHNTSAVTVRGRTSVIDADLGHGRELPWHPIRPGEIVNPPIFGRDLGTLVVPPGELRVPLVEGRPRTMHAVLVYDPIGSTLDNPGAVPVRDPALGVSEPVSSKISESVEIARDERETAGLPGGPVRLLERRDDGSLALLAEARLFDAATRASDRDTISIGTAAGVTGKRERRELTDEESRHRLVEDFVIEIDNTRTHPVDVLVREHLYRGQTWALAYWSVDEIHQEGAQAFAMRTRVPGRGQVKILYVVVYTWGT